MKLKFISAYVICFVSKPKFYQRCKGTFYIRGVSATVSKAVFAVIDTLFGWVIYEFYAEIIRRGFRNLLISTCK